MIRAERKRLCAHHSALRCAGSEATKGRTSLTCHMSKKIQPAPILLTKIQALTNKPFGHMELPQVARYTDGQRYVEHYDGVDPHTEAGRAFCANGGQRVGTVLVYLNDVPDGGATAFRRVNFEVLPKKGRALIFFPGFMNGELDTDALHAGMPAVDVKWVSQVWLRQSFREDGQPSQPVPDTERTLMGPLHRAYYRGHCLAGDDILEAVMTIPEAIEWASNNKQCYGFTYNSAEKEVDGPIRIWFKSKLNVLYNEVRARRLSSRPLLCFFFLTSDRSLASLSRGGPIARGLAWINMPALCEATLPAHSRGSSDA